jgi:tetratricopeptide (TPR) repeat protein
MTQTSDTRPAVAAQETSLPKSPPAANASEPVADPSEKAETPWYRTPSVIMSTLALVVSVVSGVATVANNRSNRHDQDRQQLLGLVQDLSQYPSQLATLQQTYGKNPAQLQALNSSLITSEDVETEESAQLIAALGNQVPGVEAYQVGSAFYARSKYAQAINMYVIALDREQDPFVKSSIYRAWAQSLYAIGQPDQAREKIQSAYSVFDGVSNLGPYVRTQNYIFTTLFQVPQEVGLHNCAFARKQFASATILIPSLPITSSSYKQDSSEAGRERPSVKACSP